MNGFWTDGADSYGEALKKQYDAELATLRTQLKSVATEPQRQDIEQQIAQLTETYRTKTRAIRRSLF